MARPSDGFVHLHTHTEYSLLDGMGRVGDVVAAAAADGQRALAITDHGTLAGAWKHAHACKAAGIKPILGAELYLAIGSRFDPQVIQVPGDAADIDGGEEQSGTKRKSNQHLTVLAATPTGWLNLVKISNKAQESFRGKPLADFDLLAEHGEGLIVLTGCLGGPVAGPLAGGDEDLAEANLVRLMDAVGAENVYVEIMDHGIGAETAVLKPLAGLADRHGLTMVATNDAHFVHDDDCETHEVWLAAQSKATLEDPKRFRFNGTGYHLRTEDEMRGLRPDSQRWQDACTATTAVAARVEDWVLPESRFRMPRFALPDGFDDYESYLHHLVLQGAVQRYGSPLPAEVKQRLRHESDIINSLGFGVYFIILHELVSWARTQGILVGPGRGSSAGSCLAYCLRITDVEPLAAKLLFERFLEQGRTDMPDIDVDFEQRRIPEIHAHLRDLYGSDCVARLGTFAMARTKRAIKDAARVYGRNDLGNKMATLVPVSQGRPARFAELMNPDFVAGEGFRAVVDSDPMAEQVLDHASIVENAVLGTGIHACGVVVSGEPLTELVPLRKDRSGAYKDLPPEQQPWVTDWDGKDTEAFGLLKLDALFLRSLDVLAETSRIIAETTGEHVDFGAFIDTADLSDPKVAAAFQLLREGRTSAIFQMESGGMRDLLVGAGPTCLEDLSAISALYRPGPLSAGMAERYVQRRNGREDVDYSMYTDDQDEQEWLATVLDPTSGLMVFQEQSMLLGTVVAGFDAAGRAKLRRAIGKKKADLMAEVGKAFLDGAGKEFRDAHGEVVSPVFSRATAERLWDMLKGSASYAFNKCLTGDTVLGASSQVEWTIGELYRRIEACTAGPSTDGLCRFDGRRAIRTTGRCKVCDNWWHKFSHPDRGLTILAYDFADDRIRPKRVKTVNYNGVRPVFRIELSDGRSVKATDNHRFLTPSGWRHVFDMSVGDTLLTHGGYEKSGTSLDDLRTTSGERQGVGTVWGRMDDNVGFVDGGFVALQSWTEQSTTAGLKHCSVCYQTEGRLERAHLDGNRRNNTPANLSWMCVSHHKQHDYAHNGRRRRWQKGHAVTEAKIISIIAAGSEAVYDVEMDDVNHSFVANGIVSHNSHSQAYAKVTFLTAYAKANWPAQTAAAVLACTDDDEKRRRVLLDLAADGIEVAPPDINKGRATTSVGADGRLRLGLAEIRDVGKAADLLIMEREANGPFRSLLDLTSRVSGTGCSVKVFEALVEAGALDSFGPRLGLMMVVRADRDLSIDAEWGGLERSERQRYRLGVRVGQHPLTPHRQALRNWQSFDGEHRETGEFLGRHAMGVAKMRRTNLDRKGSNVLVAGVLTRWEQSTGNHGASVRFDLEGSDGSWIEGVMWTKQLTRLLRHGGVPPLGSVVAVDGWATRRTIQVRAGTDGSDIDARDHDSIERVTEVEVLRLRADSIEVIDLLEVKRVDLNSAPARICIADAAERGRHILAARNLSKRRRKPAGLSARPAGPVSAAPCAPAGPASTWPAEPAAAATGPADTLPQSTIPSHAARGNDSAARVVLVTMNGRNLTPHGASSGNGVMMARTTKSFVGRNTALAPVLKKAGSASGLVYRMTARTGEQLYALAVDGRDLPRNWWRTVFEVLDGLEFGPSVTVEQTVVQISTCPLARAALDPSARAADDTAPMQPALPLPA